MILEEQRRVLVSLENDALLWDRRRGVSATFTEKCAATRGGLEAYAAEQADLRRRMKVNFHKLWTGDKEVLKLLEDDGSEGDRPNVGIARVPYIYVHDDSEDECAGHGLGEESDDE